MGGEKKKGGSPEKSGLGSPPHGRGKGKPTDLENLYKRITPAWAGKSQLSGKQLRYEEDHPRMGGEKLAIP